MIGPDPKKNKIVIGVASFTDLNLSKKMLPTKLKSKIIKFRDDELNHKDIAYEAGATKEGFYSIFDKIIKTGSKLAINISEKI